MSTLFSHFLKNINHISPLEHEFTEVLESIALKPKTLYFYGKLPENMVKNGKIIRPKTVAIVGSRHNTRYGEEVAYRLGYELAKRGVVVVSGLAYGIDSIGHRAALDAGGCTVAVLGTPIDQIYPRGHLGLAEEIVKNGGAILSEYAPRNQKHRDEFLPLGEAACLAPGEYFGSSGARMQDARSSFLHRNRLISGLSDVVVVVEAAMKSGTLNTAAHALEQGKEVFAVPGNITSPYSQGCNKLISQGAIPYAEPDDILRLLFPEDYIKKHKTYKRLKLIGDTDVETAILASLQAGLRAGEEIMQAAALPPEVFNQTITMLEIKGRVRALGANNWGLN